MAVPTARALRAIRQAAGERGLRHDRVRVIRDRTNVLARLEGTPVVARVPITLALLRPEAWFAQEVALARFLADAGAPVAPPARDVDPGPSPHDGLLVTFWEHVDHDPARFEPELAGRALRDLHSALEPYGQPLPEFDRLDEVGRLLGSLDPSPLVSAGELEALRLVHAQLRRPESRRWRPLHGDSHFNNVLWTPDGPLWSDFENACRGPVEYDLACLLWRAAPGTDEALRAYGLYDEGLVSELEPYLALFLAVWTIVVVDRAPSAEALAELRRRIERATEGSRPG